MRSNDISKHVVQCQSNSFGKELTTITEETILTDAKNAEKAYWSILETRATILTIDIVVANETSLLIE